MAVDNEPVDRAEDNSRPSIKWLLLHPVTIIANAIVFAVILLVAFAVFGWDKGRVLQSLAQYDFARGLITYIFGIGTIGLSVVLVVGAMLGGSEIADRFNRAKEILALLLGIFGTMVGFYYGSELAAKTHEAPSTPLYSAKLELSKTEAAPGEEVVAVTNITGGQAPFKARATFDDVQTSQERVLQGPGLFLQAVLIPNGTMSGPHLIKCLILDARGDSVSVHADISVHKP